MCKKASIVCTYAIHLLNMLVFSKPELSNMYRISCSRHRSAQGKPHNQTQSAQSSTIIHNRTIAQSKCKFSHNRTIKMQIFAQSHNQNASFCTIAQSISKF